MQRIAAGFHRLSKRDELGGGRTYTIPWAPGWVLNSQEAQLQGFEEKSQEPILMGSWLRFWPPGRPHGAVFTSFRNTFNSVWGLPR